MTKLKKSNKLALEALAARLKAGASYEDFDKELDKLLCTELAERDLAIERDWEHCVKDSEGGEKW
jgi:hypothetical protein